jgi:hypothetical protein
VNYLSETLPEKHPPCQEKFMAGVSLLIDFEAEQYHFQYVFNLLRGNFRLGR